MDNGYKQPPYAPSWLKERFNFNLNTFASELLSFPKMEKKDFKNVIFNPPPPFYHMLNERATTNKSTGVQLTEKYRIIMLKN